MTTTADTATVAAAGTATAPLSPALRAEARELAGSLIPKVNRFRLRQADNGTVPAPRTGDEELLAEIRDEAGAWYVRNGRPGQAAALAADVDGWLREGLDGAPDFARSRDALTPPPDGGHVFFLAPAQTTNSVPPVGKRLDCFLALRKEPDALAQLATSFPHPKNNCQSLVLVAGSHGFAHGNCLVFFPENVAARDKVRDQPYAMFFYNKMRKIHETYALPGAEAVLTAGSVPRASSGLAPEVCYEARAIWGYLHDSLHYQGRWPFDQHIALKMNWFVGLLEETKVDARTVLACADGGVPFAREQMAMILLERVFRYPQADDATRNFDSGTGVFLYSWLRRHHALTGSPEAGGLLRLDWDKTLDALRAYVAAVEEIEDRVRTDDEYRAAAKEFVRTYLPPGEAKQRFGFTEDQSVLLRAKRTLAGLPALRFADAEW
ncbi:DUF6421 family protein [Streptomyces sp. NPDC002104]